MTCQSRFALLFNRVLLGRTKSKCKKIRQGARSIVHDMKLSGLENTKPSCCSFSKSFVNAITKKKKTEGIEKAEDSPHLKIICNPLAAFLHGKFFFFSHINKPRICLSTPSCKINEAGQETIANANGPTKVLGTGPVNVR